MNILKKLFGNKEVHDQKNAFTSEILQISQDIKQIGRNSLNTRRRVKNSVTYKIAVATGATGRGLL